MFCIKRSTRLAHSAYREYCELNGNNAIRKSLQLAEEGEEGFYSHAELVQAEVKLKQMILTASVIRRRMMFMKRSNIATLI